MRTRLSRSLLLSIFIQQTISIQSNSTNNSPLINLNSSLSAVCTPFECIQGANSLSAGTTVISPSFNGTSRSTVLLPGTYTSSSNIIANTSILNFDSTTSTYTTPAGFSSSGILGSSFTISLLPGFTTYSAPLFQGLATYNPLSNLSHSVNSTTSTALSTTTSTNNNQIQSFLISDNIWVILSIGSSPTTRLVVWKGVSDIGNLIGVGISSTSNQISLLDLQSSNCPIPCSSGGTCTSNSSCVCKPGFTGATCNACAPGFFGPTCQSCAVGCLSCDSGITGTGRCLPTPILNSTASACNCINGVCSSNLSTATCACNAGWSVAGNGTQCGACAIGYFPSSSGDCLACDPTCASCSGPSGICLTCQPSLQPLSSDATKCTTSNSALSNGTFISCPPRTFYQSTSSSCVACNPLCDTCYASTPGSCLSCRTPNALLNGQCVGFSSSNGVCDSVGVTIGGILASNNAGWVLDNLKGECDALPAKCTAGSIDNFTSASTRSQLTCSSCLAGSFLYNGKCLSTCPIGATGSIDGKSCVACDSSCASCSGSPTYCTLCSNPTKLTLNGTCINGPTCPSGFFTPIGNSTCLSCHPDCQTCGTTFDRCLTCSSTRPVLTSTNNGLSSTCLQTCSMNQFYDSIKSSCTSCSSSCETCSGSSDNSCLSCSSNMILKHGSCQLAKQCTTVVPYFGVCLASLVTIAATSISTPSPINSTVLPWWTILLIILGVLLLLVLLGILCRRKEQKKRRLQTAKFADDLGQKEVNLKLEALPYRVAYPVLPPQTLSREQEEFEEELRNDNRNEAPLTPPFVGRMEEERNRASSRWSGSSFGTTANSKRVYPKPLIPQETGNSVYSQNTIASSKSQPWGTHNPYNR